jgi:hypothetical protein
VPELAARCRALRPECIVEQAALVGPDYGPPTVTVRYANLMSVVPGARGSEADDRPRVALGERLQGVSSYDVEAPARTLKAVLDPHSVTRVTTFCPLTLRATIRPRCAGWTSSATNQRGSSSRCGTVPRLTSYWRPGTTRWLSCRITRALSPSSAMATAVQA